eukprot:10103850-Ditylum_brightwellii.AAC.1
METMITCGYIPRIFKRPHQKCSMGSKPNTDCISAQYHIIFDDIFTTVAATSDTDQECSLMTHRTMRHQMTLHILNQQEDIHSKQVSNLHGRSQGR